MPFPHLSRAPYAAGLAAALTAVLAQPAAAMTCPGADGAPVRFEAGVQPVLNQHCVMCHQTGAANASLNLEPGLAYKNLVGAPSTQSHLLRVKPGAPEDSYMVRKIKGTQTTAGGSGVQMPSRGRPLDEGDIDAIVSWIKDCAPD